MVVGCGGGSSPISVPFTLGTERIPERVLIAGAGELGVFDPSVEYDPNSGRMWMSYSSVDRSAYYLPTVFWRVSIRLAYSDDNGENWQDAGVIVGPNDERRLGPLTESHPTESILINSKGIWQSETSSLIYDPSAPLNERWKLVWHQYLHADGTPFYADYGWIAMKMAATPLGLETATAVKLFAGFGLQPDAAIMTAPVYSPTGGAPLIRLNSEITQAQAGANLTDLSQCIFSEPGLHATSSSLYLAIYCADAATTPITEYIVYFICASPCSITSASAWEYAGRILTRADALSATGENHYQAPEIVEKNGKSYLITTPVDGNYNGCRVYEFVDVNTTQLRRSVGRLVEIERIDGDDATHSGACSYYAGLDGGILISDFDLANAPETFRIYKSKVTLPD